MLGNRFFLQICAVSFLGLTMFAVVASFAWNAIGEDQFNRALFQRTTGLAELLLPAADAPASEQQNRIVQIAEELSFDITLYDPSGTLIAASAAAAPWSVPDVAVGNWQATKGETRWMTTLGDGRVLIIDLNRMSLPNEKLAATITFVVLAAVISLLLYPLTRRITRRLERLQQDVEKIGAGNLSARVTVDGSDEIAKLAISFNRSTETIEDLVNRQRLLLANASHELRTPLARIRMGIELLETKNTPERRAEMRQDIRELDALIDDLITMTRFDTGFDTGSAIGDFAPVNLKDIAQKECSRTKGCTFEGSDAHVSGDVRMLQHLVRNLLDNAERHGQHPIRIKTETHRDGVSLAVIDHGNGIPESDRSKVFEPFYRGAGKQNVSGYGLGLPLVSRIAKSHSAEVSISAHPVSTVTVHFPHMKPAHGKRAVITRTLNPATLEP